MPGQVCIDASFILALLLPDQRTSRTTDMWQNWLKERILCFAPPLFFAEVTSVLREKVYFKELTPEEGDDVFQRFLRLRVANFIPSDLHQRAWELAKRYNLSRAYDPQYLAVAEALDCDLWTADRRLSNNVRTTRIKLITA
jgi:predicted nucleic acid-binding protein